MQQIHNINYRAPFLIYQDFYTSPTVQDLLNHTVNGEVMHRLHWGSNITSSSGSCMTFIKTLADQAKYSSVLQELQEKLHVAGSH